MLPELNTSLSVLIFTVRRRENMHGVQINIETSEVGFTEREKSKGQEETGLGENPHSLLYVTGPATKRQKASAIISFTGVVCLRTISVALGEEESADECSCLLSEQSRGRGAHCWNNFERQR